MDPADPWNQGLPKRVGGYVQVDAEITEAGAPKFKGLGERIAVAIAGQNGFHPCITDCRFVALIIGDGKSCCGDHAPARVVIEWTDEYMPISGHGGSGHTWRESRGIFTITNEQFLLINRVWNEQMRLSAKNTQKKSAST